MQLQRLPRIVSISVSSPGYPYLPYLPGESQGGDAQSSPPIESSRRCADFKFEFGYFSLTDFSPASTILKVIVLRVSLRWTEAKRPDGNRRLLNYDSLFDSDKTMKKP